MAIRLIDLYGRTVKIEHLGSRLAGTYQHVWQLGDIPDGAYLLMLHNGTSYKTVRIIVAGSSR